MQSGMDAGGLTTGVRPLVIGSSVPQATERAVSLHRQGRLAEAEQIYAGILKVQPSHFDSLRLLGLLRYQQGRYGEALPLFESARRLEPGSPDLLSSYGLLLQRLGRHAEALAAFDRAITLRPGDPAVLCNRGLLLMDMQRPAEALESFDRALMARRDCIDALVGRGLALHRLRRYTDALVSLDRVLALDPRHAEALTHRAGLLYELERFAEAIDTSDRAIAVDPRNATAHYNRGVVLAAMGRPAEAVASYSEALACNPGEVSALYNRGNIFERTGRLGEALADFDRVLALSPDHSRAWNNRGNVLTKTARHAEALASYERALALNPGYAECWYNHGNALRELERVPEALAHYRRALALGADFPELRFNEGCALLLLGELREGLKLYEARFEQREHAPIRRAFAQARWEGGELADKTILLHSEQGHGDTIQFARYVPLVARLGGTVLLEVQSQLKPLLGGLEGVARTFGRDERGRSEELPAFDTHQYLASLPRVLGTGLGTIPADVPYIRAPAARLERWRERLPPASALRVGLTWSGNPLVKSDATRSIGLPRLRPLVDVPGVQFVSLHREVRPEHAGALADSPQIVHFGEQLADFADTAAVIAQLDLVISTDTAVAHLAGAMGKPVWVLTQLAPDWRWLLGREDSPWYPTAKLYRQRRYGDWEEVVGRVRDDLLRLAK
ncbi:MAG TPA: tetratricopeptide repeat protein [Stellaceae bacterium]|nr:tetratricopeptide repeat protein [Stellaceae bacterium]